MRIWDGTQRGVLDALDEPAVVAEGHILVAANRAARELLGSTIEGRDIRLAIRHPQALEAILAHRSAEIDVTGIGEVGRSWRLIMRALGGDSALVRMVDRSDRSPRKRCASISSPTQATSCARRSRPCWAMPRHWPKRSDLPADLRASFGRTIRDEARRMLRIIEDLMSLSRIEADRFIAPNDRVSIGRSRLDRRRARSDMRGGRQCTFIMDIPEGLPAGARRPWPARPGLRQSPGQCRPLRLRRKQ